MSGVQVTAYGGAGQIGGNKILLEDGQLQVFLDFGLNFEDQGRYYAEFLQPRASSSGTYDYLMTALLPPLHGIYRQDAALEILDRFAWKEARGAPGYREDVLPLGVLVSHAHMDHVGLISFLRPEIRIVSTAATATIAKAIQDTAAGGMETEVAYIGERDEDELEQTLQSVKNSDFQRREWRIVDAANWSAAAGGFWGESSRAKRALAGPEAAGFDGSLGPLKVQAFPVDHSIMGAAAYAVATAAGWVVYTGDLRKHGRGSELTRTFAEAARALRPAALICEATRAGADEGRSFSEADVRANSLAAVRREAGLVIADFGPRNVERLITFLEVAEATKRRLVILPKDAYLLAAMAAVAEGVPDPGSTEHLWIYKDREGRTLTWKKRIWERYSDRVVNWEDVAAFPGQHILCLSFYDLPRLLDINPSGGSYIYSTSEPYTEEQEIDFKRLQNWLNRFNLTLVGHPTSTAVEDRGLHASGHASDSELLELIELIAPATLIPVHTKTPDRFRQAFESSPMEVKLPLTGVPIPIRPA